MPRKKKPEDAKKLDSRQRIIRFLTKTDIVLSSTEETILSRWEYADLLMRQGITLTEILIDKLQEKFSVSKFTADSDVSNSMDVFSKSRKVNRKYLGHLHLQDISADLSRIRNDLFKDKKIPDAKLITALTKLHDAYTYQLNSLPDETDRPPVGRITMQFALPAGQTVMPAMSLKDALLMADKITDIDHEEINLENGKAKD